MTGKLISRPLRRQVGEAAAWAADAWLRPEQFDYSPLGEARSVVRLLAALESGFEAPEEAILEVARAQEASSYPSMTSIAQRVERDGAGGMLWRVSFGVPLEIVEYPDSLFTLAVADGLTVALPRPKLHQIALASTAGLPAEVIELSGRRGAVPRVLRHLVALATGFAVATASGSVAGVAAAGTTASTTSDAPPALVQTAASSPTPPSHTQTGTSSSATSDAAAATTEQAPSPPATPTATMADTTTSSAAAAAPAPTTTVGIPHTVPTPPPPPTTTSVSAPHASLPSDVTASAPVSRVVLPTDSPARHPAGVVRVLRPHHASGGAGLHVPATVRAPTPAEDEPDTAAPATTTGPATGAGAFAGMFSDPFTASQLAKYSKLFANLNQPPKFLIPIYKAAGKRYHVQWQILAAINSIETNYGRNLSTSSAGAIGWMQFMPATWMAYGVAAHGDRAPNPYSPWDAIFSAARYLAANGAPRHIRRAIFAYNHALWYVDSVLWRAQMISDRALGKHRRKGGYALPLDARYMHVLGRTDDGLDIEDAPDGAAVYSITPGIVTAVASDPSGFGPNYPVVQVTKGPLAGQFIYYGHVAVSLVHRGQRVLAGQPIAVMGHTGDAASLGHGHVEIGFSDAAGDPLNHHGAAAWTPSGDAMRHVIVGLSAAFRIKNS